MTGTNARHDSAEVEKDLEMRGTKKNKSFQTYLTEDISTVNADWLLCLVSLGVGAIDGFSFPDLKVFAANMTGNLVFLALAASQVNDDFLSARRSSVALVLFWAGAFVSGQLGHKIGTKVRWWVAFAFFWQGMLILTAAICLWSGGVSREDLATLDSYVLALVAVLAFSYGAQATTARGLGVAEIPTVVVTSAMVDLFGDKNLFKRDNRPRNRRIGFIISVFLGGFIGGWVISRVNAPLTIAVASSFKFLAALCVCFMESADSQKARIKQRQLQKDTQKGIA